MQPTPGKNFLFVTGILYIVFGGLAVLSAFMALFAFALIAAIEPIPFSTFFVFQVILSLAMAAYQLYIGIVGIKYRTNFDKAPTLRTLGIIDIILAVLLPIIVVASIMSVLFGQFWWHDDFFIMFGPLMFMSAIIGLVFRLPLPILYIIGAQKNLAAHRNQVLEQISRGGTLPPV